MRASNVRFASETLLAHSRAYPTAFAGALILLCIPQAYGQVIITPATISAPVIQSVPGTCASYNATLTTTGVQLNGASNPGHCVKSQFTPLFNGQPIGTNWQQLMLGPNPPKFKETIQRGKQTCVTATALGVDLSARVDVSELNWVPTQTIGTVCTNETNRVNIAPMVSAQNLRADAQTDLEKTVRSFIPGKSPGPITACSVGLNNARPLLYQKIWQLLDQIAIREQNGWHDPENAQAAQCAPRCNLCNPGWVGTLTCKKTLGGTTGTNNWNETQTWSIGGVPQQTMGGTLYPATYTADGRGSKVGVTWPPFHLTAQGTVKVIGTQQSPSFQTSQIPFPNKDIPSSPAGDEATEVAFQIPTGFFLLSPSNYTYDGPCDIPAPGVCHVDCSWNLAFQ